MNTDNLGFGSTVNFIVNAFEYNNKFTKGETYVGASLSAVVILTGKKTGADADLNELLNDVPETKFKTRRSCWVARKKMTLHFDGALKH